LDAVWTTLIDETLQRLAVATTARGGQLPEASRIVALFTDAPRSRMAAAALEMAVLDAELRTADASLVDRLAALDDRTGEHLAPPPEEVDAGALVGIPADHRLATLLGAVDHLVDQGFARVRVKIEPGWDVVPMSAVRRAHPQLVLQADANGAYRLGGTGDTAAERLAELDPLGLGCVEQPLSAHDLTGHAALSEILATPVCLDESLSSLRRVRDALRYGSCSVACLKPARLGGVFATQVAQATCRAGGVRAFVGGFFETGLGRTVNATLSTLAGFSMPGDLSPPAHYLTADPFGYPEVRDGRVRVYRGAGVAPAPDPEALGRFSRPEQIVWVPYAPGPRAGR
jgi:O-succinylbenzoate synthase